MSLGTHAKVIATATRELERKWEATKLIWRDAKAEEFEREHLAELFGSVNRTTGVMEELEMVLTRLRKECE